MKVEVFHDWLQPMWESDTYEWKVDVRSVIDIKGVLINSML